MEAILAYFGSGILGGLLVAGINWARVSRTEREKRHSEYVSEQLKRLYGPLYFLTSHNEELLRLNNKILSAYKGHFEDNDWSNDSHTRESLKKESEATIELANEYVSQVVTNNVMIVELIKDNYAFIDTEDIQILMEFVVDFTRMNKEVKEERLKKIPLEVYYNLGEISYSRPEFISSIKNKFIIKQNLIRRYH